MEQRLVSCKRKYLSEDGGRVTWIKSTYPLPIKVARIEKLQCDFFIEAFFFV